MADRSLARHALRGAIVLDAVRVALPPGSLDILDAGGGTGGFAVPLAEDGHRVTVLDPSPDSLAALERRIAEAGVSGSVRAVQGEAAAVREVLGDGVYDVVLCHSVLEVVDDPRTAIGVLAGVLRDGGLASVLVANRAAAVLARALAGRLDEATALLDDPTGRWGPSDALARRFTEVEIVALLSDAGLRVRSVHGIRTVSDLISGAVVDADPVAAEELLGLERRLSTRREFLPVAGQLHVLADRG